MNEYCSMIEYNFDDYVLFCKNNGKVTIGEVEIELRKDNIVKSLGPSSEFTLEQTTVWSFPERGSWATHQSNYRGNWSPFIPRNLILKFTKEGDWVLDQMMGSGTTLVEAKLLGRNAIGVDINKDAVMLALDRLNFETKTLFESSTNSIIKTYQGDARNLDKIDNNGIDLIATHPPYANIISYSKNEVAKEDLSHLPLKDYLIEMKKVAEEAYRVLKPGKVCAILIGDTRKNKHYIPLAFRVMESFLDAGFILKEDIIKIQHNMKKTKEIWARKSNDFYLIAHEHIFIFKKPSEDKERRIYKFSSKWW